ncbi:hypothetical protein LOAG_16613 [Loa loa]|uniref:SCP domain-containing protein n=1 Tax=Loa loa TaxID=7209 RepID=A0A1I7VQ36_LOALO|nr:hypothetical protein LOAG_16613 [Loa loa]EJD76433.1 hypothetical protein LOAG_16613 [Loa loa]
MAFYFALMNISNASLDNPTKRRSSSVSRNHQIQRSNQRRCTFTAYDADTLFKQEELSSQNYRNRREFYENQKDSKLRNDIQEKKVVFEKRESEKAVINTNNFLGKHAFSDKRHKTDANNKEKNIGWYVEHLVTTFHNTRYVEYKQRNFVKKSLSIWKTYSCADVIDAWLPNTKRSNSKHEAKINEGYPLGLSAYSNRDQRVNDRGIAPSIVQNAANELIEHKLVLSAPPRRRNFWKSVTLSRRRSVSNNYSKYKSSYFNPGFHFVEDELEALENDCNAVIPTDENYTLSSYIYSKGLPLTDVSHRI